MVTKKETTEISSEHVHGPTNSMNGCLNSPTNGYVNDKINGYLHGTSNALGNGQDNNAVDICGNISIDSNTKDCQTSAKLIAICGLAMRLPGGIRDAETFWAFLRDGKDARGPIPPDRYNIHGFNDSLGKKGAIKTQYGYFLDEDLARLDTSFFTMTGDKLEKMDPQQRQLLEVTRECLENAGEVDYRGKPIGCYVGTFGEDWLQMSAKESQHFGGYIMTGHGDLMIANRVSYEYDLQGPRYLENAFLYEVISLAHKFLAWLSKQDVPRHWLASTRLAVLFRAMIVAQPLLREQT